MLSLLLQYFDVDVLFIKHEVVKRKPFMFVVYQFFIRIIFLQLMYELDGSKGYHILLLRTTDSLIFANQINISSWK